MKNTIRTENHEYTAVDCGITDYAFICRNDKYLGYKDGARLFVVDPDYANPCNAAFFTGEMTLDFDLDSIPDEEATE
jgi:hypothetical protein